MMGQAHWIAALVVLLGALTVFGGLLHAGRT